MERERKVGGARHQQHSASVEKDSPSPSASRTAPSLAKAFLLGRAPYNDFAIVALHQVLFDPDLIRRIATASRNTDQITCK